MGVERPAAALASLILALGIVASPLGPIAAGLGFDLLVLLRHGSAPGMEPRASGEVAVVAIDERTYKEPPFRDLPLSLWAPYQAQLLEALLEGGAEIVAYDLVFATSTEAALRGYDRAFRLAIRRGSAEGRLILGEFLGGSGIVPHRSFEALVAADDIRPLDVFPDRDGVLRAIPMRVRTEEGERPSLAGEILARRLGKEAAALRTAAVRFDVGASRQTVPHYSFADLVDCAAAGDDAFFEQRFSGRIVLVGVDLLVEDRLAAANRFVAPPPAVPSAVCRPGADKAVPLPVPWTAPGIHLHAATIDQVIAGRTLIHPPPLLVWTAVAAIALLGVAPPLLASRGRRAWAPIWLAAPLLVLAGLIGLLLGAVLPLGQMLLALGTGFSTGFLQRVGVLDRDQRRLRRTLGLYLPAAEIARLHNSGGLPELGGETRSITVMLVDVVSFTRFAESATPAETTARLNAHFERLSAVVESEGGIIDRFVGDAIVALFGAPIPHEDHARRAVRAAVALLVGAPPANGAEAPAYAAHEPFQVRVGIATGPVLVGNIGTQRRFNYTAIGDTVNLASRLEGLNKVYGTRILVSGATAEGCADLPLRPIDRVRVVGRDRPVDLATPVLGAFREDAEPGGEAGLAPAEEELLVGRYADALRAYRAGAFAEAEALLAPLAAADPPAATLLARCRRFTMIPPPPGWDGTWAADSK